LERNRQQDRNNVRIGLSFVPSDVGVGRARTNSMPIRLCRSSREVLRIPDQNRIIIASVTRSSFSTRSGVKPGTISVGSPVLPPAGVMPPLPEKYGTFAWRWLYSRRKVTFLVGM